MLIRKMWRTIWNYKAQFISMIVMIALGVGIFVGFHTEWNSIRENTLTYFEETNFADYRAYLQTGFSAEEAARIREIDGIDGAQRRLSVDADVKGTDRALALNVAEDFGISDFIVTEGKEYDPNGGGMWLSDQYAKANGVRIGDVLTVTYKKIEIRGEVTGFVKCSEYMVCVRGDSQIMPDYSSYGYVFITPQTLRLALGFDFYTQVFIKSNLSKTQIQAALDQTLRKTTLVLSKEDNVSYLAAQSEIEEGQTMGFVLPVLFLLIALLTMITTMHRITANEKTQIGTLKALGFRDSRILRHYTAYAFMIGIVGGIFGIALGLGIAAVIVGPAGTMSSYFDLPAWKLYVPWFCWTVLVGLVALLTGIGLLSVKKMLRGTAADALRPYVPKKIKKTALEKTKLWNKLSFGTKWNLRDVLRHKSRSLMTLVGVAGCMILLVGGLGMKDTMTGFTNLLYHDVSNYITRINLADTVTNEDAEALSGVYSGDWLAAEGVRYRGRTITLEIYNVMTDKIRFAGRSSGLIKLEHEGAYICIRIADEGVNIGDTIEISPYGGDAVYSVRVAGVVRSMTTESVIMTKEYAEQIGIPYRIGAIYTDTAQESVMADARIASTQTKQAIVDSFDRFMAIMNMMVFILVMAAVVLGIVVLYNLGVMSYTERYRELATLKVVGFQDKRIGRLLINQNVWLTVIGILIGFPAGVGVLYFLLTALAGEYELKMIVGALTCCVSILLTLGVSLIVNFFIARKNRKVNMAEALKGAE